MNESLQARAPIASPATATGEFMIMAGGVQTIHCGQGSKDVSVQVLVDRSTAANLQKQFTALCAAGAHRPYFDFDHDDKMASFWPSAFVWSESPAPGVYARGEWSAAGRAAIEGKTYRAFSPKFHVDSVRAKPARVICYEQASLNMGGLVNDPAFKNNLPLWAKSTAKPTPTAATPHVSNHSMKTKEEVAALTARKSELETEIHALHASGNADAATAEALVAKQGELDRVNSDLQIAALEAQNAEKDAALLAQRTKDAEAAVLRGVTRGAIPAKDVAMQAHWKRLIIEDPSNITLLDAMKGSPALDAGNRPGAILPRISVNQIAITRASNKDMLTGLAAINAKNRGDERYEKKKEAAREFAALYAKEIVPRLREGDDIPLEADNSLGTLSGTIVSMRTLELLTLNFPLLQAIATDFSDQIVTYGDTLKTRIVGIPTVATYHTTNGWPTESDANTTDVSITYDQFKAVPMRFRAHEISSTVRRLFDEIAPAQAYAAGKDMVDYVYALITSAFTNTVTAAGLGTFGRSTVIDIGGVLDDAANPEMGRTLLLARPYYSAVAKDNAIITLAAMQRAEIIEKGVLPDVEGFKVIKAVNLPATNIAGKTLKGFGFTKSALCVGSRLPADYVNAIPGAANGNLTVVTTPSGFSANQIQFVQHTAIAGTHQRLEWMYGGSRGQVAAGALLTDV